MPLAPQKINPIIIFDWETGGLDCTKNPVTELAMIVLNGVTLEEILRYDDMIKPYNDNLVYQQEALDHSGITMVDLNNKGITIHELGENLLTVFKEANIHGSKTARPILVAHNADFDRGFLQAVCKELKLDISKLVDGEFDPWGNFVPHVIDSVDWAKRLEATRTDHTTKFKLGHCCQRAGVEYIDGHRAINDCTSLADLFRYYSARLSSGSSEVTVSDGRAIAAHRQVFEW